MNDCEVGEKKYDEMAWVFPESAERVLNKKKNCIRMAASYPHVWEGKAEQHRT